MPDYLYETDFLERYQEATQADRSPPSATGPAVMGIDEAGRGPWAGPVMAAALWLAPQRLSKSFLTALEDSKKLSIAKREQLFLQIRELAHEAGRPPLRYAIGKASVEEIDKINILQATFLAMRRASQSLMTQKVPLAKKNGNDLQWLALVDGNKDPQLGLPTRTVIKGDDKSLSIAGASICAKVTRDHGMAALDRLYPGYGWTRNQGYGTAEHRRALDQLGITPVHRTSFRPVRERLQATD